MDERNINLLMIFCSVARLEQKSHILYCIYIALFQARFIKYHSTGPSCPLGRVLPWAESSARTTFLLDRVVPWAESSLGPSCPLGRVVPWAESSLGPSRPLDQVVLDRVVLGQVVPWTGLSAGPSCPLGRVVWLPTTLYLGYTTNVQLMII